MEKLMGLLKVKVVRGVNLAKRDARGSDPYVVIKMGNQKVKTSVKKKSVNPEWNEELTLSVTDSTVPLKLAVYDKDTFSKDDRMGDADFNMWDIAEVVTMEADQLLALAGESIRVIKPTRGNCLAEESHVKFTNGKVCQDLVLRLRNVERGEVELQLQWINIRGPEVLDKDTFSSDDCMGETEFTIHDLADVAKMDLKSIPDGTVVKTLHPTKQNLLVCDTHITVKNGKVFQALVLRLKNVDSGDIHLELQWVNVPPSAQ